MTTKTETAGCVTLVGWLLVALGGCNRPAEVGKIKVQELTPAVAAPAAQAGATARPIALSFSFAVDMNRSGAVEERGALVCRKGTCAKGIVAFGPYTRAVPAGPRVATFRVSGSGVANTDQEAASFDVYDSQHGERLGLRQVKGPELPNGKEQTFDVAFTAPHESTLEFRVGWTGEGELAMYRVDVR